MSVLRDTLGDNDPDNDRLRYIWVLTSARPTVLQHAAAFVPFFYWRPDLGKNMDRKPAAILDLGDTSKVVWNALAQSLVQAAAIDSNGALIRASTRRYRANLADQRQVNLMEGLTAISQLEEIPDARGGAERARITRNAGALVFGGKNSRRISHNRAPSGSVPQKPRANRRDARPQLGASAPTRGSQRVVFRSLGFARSRTHALLWIAREDVASREGQPASGMGAFWASPILLTIRG